MIRQWGHNLGGTGPLIIIYSPPITGWGGSFCDTYLYTKMYIYTYAILDTFKIGGLLHIYLKYNKTLAWGGKSGTSGSPPQFFVGVIWGLYKDHGKENGNYYNGGI